MQIVDQVTLFNQEIEDSFSAKKKAGTVFVNLTAAYNTIWHRGLTCKLLRFLLDKHIVSLIRELFSNPSFTLTTDRGKKESRKQRLKNGVSQRSVLAPFVFNIYTYGLPETTARKFVYADDLAILHYASMPLCYMHYAILHYALCTMHYALLLPGLRRDSYSGHGNPILLSLQTKAQAQYNKNCVDGLSSL